MANSNLAFLMKWSDGGLAVTETYYMQADVSTGLVTIWNNAFSLYKLRSLMMGHDVLPVSMRLTQMGLFRAYANADPALIANVPMGNVTVQVALGANPPPGVGATQDGSADQAPAAITTDAYSSIQSHSRKFLGGVPDVLVRTNPNGPWIVGVPSWKTAFDNYAAELKGAKGWVFHARILPSVAGYAPVQVSGYSTDMTTGNFQVDCPTIAVLGATPTGKVIQLRAFTMRSKAYTNVNGQWKVASTSTSAIGGNTVYQLVGKRNVSSTSILSGGTVEPVGFDFYSYKEVFVNKQTTHKRGNRSLAGPGRRTRRATVAS